MSVTNIHNKTIVYTLMNSCTLSFYFIMLIAIKITDTQHINYEEKINPLSK